LKARNLLSIRDLEIHLDDRGSFCELSRNDWSEMVGFAVGQVSLSSSVTGVLRGFHYSSDHQRQAFILLSGEIFEVVLDVSKAGLADSSKFAQRITAEYGPLLCVQDYQTAHAYQVIQDCQMLYLNERPYDRELERNFHWLSVGTEIWPLKDPLISERDRNAPIIQVGSRCS